MAFVPSCEMCGERVEDADHLQPVRCDTCAETQKRTTTAKKIRQFKLDRAAVHQPPCEKCGSISSPRKHERLNPVNLHAEYRLLCAGCGKKLGFTPVNFSRQAVHGWHAA